MNRMERLVGFSAIIIIMIVFFQGMKMFHDYHNTQSVKRILELKPDSGKTLLQLSLDLLDPSFNWSLWCIICTILGLAEFIGYICLIEVIKSERLLFVSILILIMSNAMWLSVTSRDVTQRRQFQQSAQFKIYTLMSGYLKQRLFMSVLFCFATIVIIVLGIQFVDVTSSSRLVGYSSSFIVCASIFQQTKSLRDSNDSLMLRSLL